MKEYPNISPNKVLSILLLFGIWFSIVQITKAIAPNPGHNFTEVGGGITQGQIVYGSSADTFSALAKDINATRYLSNTGASNNPAWAQVNLANGVTGNLATTSLNSGMGAGATTTWRGDGTWGPPVAKSFWGGGSSASLAASNVCGPLGYSVCNTTLSTLLGVVVPYGVTIKNLYGEVDTAPGVGTTCSFTVNKSTGCTAAYAATTLTCGVVGNGALKTCSDLTHSVSIAASDCLQLGYTEAGVCSGLIHWGFELDAQ